MLIKITESTYTVFFQTEDIIRITPVFAYGEIDCYRLDLKNESQSIQLSTQQLSQLAPLVSCVDLSIRIDDTEPTSSEDVEHVEEFIRVLVK